MATFEESWGELRDKIDDLIDAAKKANPDEEEDIQDAYDACEAPLDAMNDVLYDLDNKG